jgi:hypothetical protein
MSTPRDFFSVELVWTETAGGFVPRNDDHDPQIRPFWTAAQERLFRRGVVSGGLRIASDLPVWSLLHINPERSPSMWCFLEQGHGGLFGPTGGCRASFVRFATHPADVWRAGRDLAWVRVRPQAPDLGVAQETLAAVAADYLKIPLPPNAAGNVAVIQALLELLPGRLVRNWMWSTHLFGHADRFVAGRLPDQHDDRGREPAGVPIDAAYVRLVRELGQVSEGLARLARASKADQFADYLDAVRAIDESSVAAVGRASALPAAPVAFPPDGKAVALAVPPPAASPSAVPAPVASPPGKRPASPFTWVEWADTGTGFERLVVEGQPDLRRYWHAAELLHDSEKVPNGVDDTLQHPLWTLRRVEVDRVDTWCFIERGRGVLLGADGKPQRENQFGMAGGCRFGFADFRRHPVDVWRAGVAEAWMRPPVGPKPPKPDGSVLESVLAGLTDNQDRIALPAGPSANRLLIERLLSVLPARVAAGWVWSTGLFKWTDRFVAGPPPEDLRSSVAMTQLAARVNREHPPSLNRVRVSLTEDRHLAFQVLLASAMTGKAVRKELRGVLAKSVAKDLPEFFDEMAKGMVLRPRRREDVTAEIMTPAGQTHLHQKAPGEVVNWAREGPEAARQLLVEQPGTVLEPELVDGLVEAQRDEPTTNVLAVPTAKTRKSEWTDQSARLLVAHVPDEHDRAELLTSLTQPGAPWHARKDLAAAEPWLRNVQLSWERHPHLFPNRIIEECCLANGVSVEARRGLATSAHPVDLIVAAVERLRRPSATQAASILLVLHDVLAARHQPVKADLDRVTRTLLGRSGRKREERQHWWAAVNERFGPPAGVADAVRTLILSSGVRILYMDGKGKPLTDARLANLIDHVGIEFEIPAIGTRDRTGLQRLLDRLMPPWPRLSWRWVAATVGILLTLAALGLVPFYSGANQPGPARQSEEPTRSASPRATTPVPNIPTAEPGTPQATFSVKWESDSQTKQAVDAIRGRIETLAGYRIVRVVLHGFGTQDYLAIDAVVAIQGALQRGDIPELANAKIDISGQATSDSKLRGTVQVTFWTVPPS